MLVSLEQLYLFHHSTWLPCYLILTSITICILVGKMYYAFMNSFCILECYSGHLQQKKTFVFASALPSPWIAAPHRHRQGAHRAAEPVNAARPHSSPSCPSARSHGRATASGEQLASDLDEDGIEQAACLARHWWATSATNCGHVTPSEWGLDDSRGWPRMHRWATVDRYMCWLSADRRRLKKSIEERGVYFYRPSLLRCILHALMHPLFEAFFTTHNGWLAECIFCICVDCWSQSSLMAECIFCICVDCWSQSKSLMTFNVGTDPHGEMG
jgi:hypothetical protein